MQFLIQACLNITLNHDSTTQITILADESALMKSVGSSSLILEDK
ncbi:unnamed protein product, partial [Rotaria sp. Silwood2]